MTVASTHSEALAWGPLSGAVRAVLVITAVLCLAAALSGGRVVRLRWRFYEEVRQSGRDSASSGASLQERRTIYAAEQLARASFLRSAHTTLLYFLLAAVAILTVATSDASWLTLLLAAAVLAAIFILWSRKSGLEFRMARERFEIERRAAETLSQKELAPRAWAGRLASEEMTGIEGFSIGHVYKAGSGLMAGDFFDVFSVSPTRVVALIGDVSGKGIESSITAFQAKYLMRVFLRQYRDPAQALEELNRQMHSPERFEEFVTMFVVVFDVEAETLRYASAGHPTMWLWHKREVLPLRSTGPVVMLGPESSYYSKEIQLNEGDMVVLYTDGLIEARRGEDIFGEEGVALLVRRDPLMSPDVLCKSLLDAAGDFSEGPLGDDVAILAIRRI